MTGIERPDISPEERVVITVDAREDILQIKHLVDDLGSRVRAVKLGQAFLLHPKPWAIVKMLQLRNVSIDFDAKYEEDADQMGPLVVQAFRKGFSSISIAPTSGSRAMQQAAYAVPPDKQLFIALPSSSEKFADVLMGEVLDANGNLPADRQIREVMCNVRDITRVKSLGDFTVIATGIRMPGDEPHDHPAVATPLEALELGADYLAIGRAVTSQHNRKQAFEQILESIE